MVFWMPWAAGDRFLTHSADSIVITFDIQITETEFHCERIKLHFFFYFVVFNFT